MKLKLVFFLFFSVSLFYSQNKYKDICNKRVEISKFIFDEVLDGNTFNSSIVTHKIFKNQNLKIYSIKTYSPHAYLNIGIFHKKKIELYSIEDDDDIKKILLFLKGKNVSINELKQIENIIRKSANISPVDVSE
ncbi:hypothetical protein NAL32_19795 [Chryseobacterium sp. Ch-15]|uniref:Uncharacterized protein n=1 Tax=Chryseobacterium muglaense TaxID=2893752 RepID=A0A9Q3V1Y7_9FLAO|nr:hypothetical protein [Chryseobacterium muglaense]MBD3906421.1 hypothetical protein [Chryseobacterium muglaense]MCC9037070.1 hypothetical protein [Chryseobacterium muglaense]MCM2556639.1 hypothetical protein [Chryseobacterium muglaense]